ncbi:Protein of unknown function [Pyronema omphalodes CBS 100304]|uniref:Uncharacterized protein n=1 Tax=Pyronema omphalodes (strain CBS 100304) TaxID=1076935 RepID=U4LBW5_PYROM|nr:Protein of unknown function [Pyronema omphalodes CBS 100304]
MTPGEPILNSQIKGLNLWYRRSRALVESALSLRELL